MHEFRLPDIGEGLHEAEIVKWLVQSGDHVKLDDALVEVQTDKAVVELPSPAAGRICEIPWKEGDVVKVGEVLVAILEESDEPASVSSTTPLSSTVPSPSSASLETSSSDHRLGNSCKHILAAPSTRKKAREMGIDIQLVQGTGPAGRVTEDDLLRYLPNKEHSGGDAAEVVEAAKAVGISEPRRIPIRGIRKKIAEKMTRSAFTAPHATSVDEVDMSELIRFKDIYAKEAENQGVKLTFLPFILKALSVAFRQFPMFNAVMDEAKQEVEVHGSHNIGIAVDTDNGLVVPCIKGVEQKTILELAKEIKQLTISAKEHKLTAADMKGGTFTVTNIGPIGGLFATPILNHPEVAILGVHTIQKRAVVINDEIVARPMMYVSLTFDHRVLDGAEVVRFTNRLKQYFEDPFKMFLQMK
ncbi:dihydrolipoamide acetyltransferase family protein [Ferviditalea candida]|uniref:Dihydrolipoamide acetyltransferase component of pyruvate dehydrogenase complex n=1 Tax=Ferviditalea candida TaxID=3108399 RepID=A0ABU5ZP88_9BACL|nr:dihydrolipoamide acetyltransferase family protein [Paenibacillaceae bacterium T2]